MPAEFMNLNKFTTWVHNTDHKIVTDFHKIEPELKRLGIDAWHGIEWCFKDDACRGAVEKYGEKAVQDAAQASLMQLYPTPYGLQELNAFTTWSHNLDTRIKTDFHKIEPELKRLGLDAWHGIEWCFKDDVCRDAVEKYGEKAVQDAAQASLMQLYPTPYGLQELNAFQTWSHNLDHRIKTDFHDIGGELKRLGLDAWHGIEWCYNTAPCKQAVEKFGEAAVETALIAAALQNLNTYQPQGQLQELNKFTTWSHNLDTRIKRDFHDIGPELKRLGLDVWHGIEWCYKTAPCRDAVEKYGEEAVETALEAAALQNLEFDVSVKFVMLI